MWWIICYEFHYICFIQIWNGIINSKPFSHKKRELKLTLNRNLQKFLCWTCAYRVFCRYLLYITNRCTIYLILNCIQNLLHVAVPHCIIIREFFCYIKVTKFLLEIMTLLSSAIMLVLIWNLCSGEGHLYKLYTLNLSLG